MSTVCHPFCWKAAIFVAQMHPKIHWQPALVSKLQMPARFLDGRSKCWTTWSCYPSITVHWKHHPPHGAANRKPGDQKSPSVLSAIGCIHVECKLRPSNANSCQNLRNIEQTLLEEKSWNMNFKLGYDGQVPIWCMHFARCRLSILHEHIAPTAWRVSTSCKHHEPQPTMVTITATLPSSSWSTSKSAYSSPSESSQGSLLSSIGLLA